jgi:hypothetical protein
VSFHASAFSIDSVRRLSTATKVCASGLLLTAAAMLVQVAAGSTLYPSIAGPVVLIAAAILVVFGPARVAPWVGLAVPLVLGIGAIAAAAMTGAFVDQLTDASQPGLVVGSVMHVVGLIAAIGGGLMMIVNRGASVERAR